MSRMAKQEERGREAGRNRRRGRRGKGRLAD